MIRGYDITVTYLYGNHSIASTFLFRRLQIYPNILQTRFIVFSHFLRSNRDCVVFFYRFLHFVSLVLAIFLAVTQLSFCGVEEQVRARCVQSNDTCDNSRQRQLAQQPAPHAQILKIIAASI